MDVHSSLAMEVVNQINTTRLQPLWTYAARHENHSAVQAQTLAWVDTHRGDIVYRLTALAMYGESGDAMNYFQNVFHQIYNNSVAVDILADVSECVFSNVVDLEARRLMKLAAWLNQAA